MIKKFLVLHNYSLFYPLGLTDDKIDKRLGPKRATRLRRLYGASKGTDVRKLVIRRTFKTKDGKERQKAAKIQRLITDLRIHRKQVYLNKRKEKAIR